MSDVAQGPNWWIASDGKWYPPELHPSVRSPEPAKAGSTGGSRPAANGAHVGPHFPDLFQAAMKGSSVADAVTVVHNGPDEYKPAPVSAGSYSGPSAADGSGGGSKKKWRKSR